MSRDLIGPALPPGFRGGDHEDEEEEEEVAGPVLPPGYRRHQSSDSSEDSDQETPHGHCHPKERNEPPQRILETPQDDDDEFFGPALPPGFTRPSDSPERLVIGPALPPGFKRQSSDSEDGSDYKGSSDKYKTAADDDDDDVIGPLPAKGHVQSSVAEDIERRALKMKQKLTSKDDELKNPARESWMTELPPELTNFGLGPRTFKRRTNERSKDRSDWTDTPADREKKEREKQEGKASSSKGDEVPQVSQRDKRLAEQVSTYNDSKRSEPLIDLHRKKLKRKADEDEGKPKERRPFDREEDLKVNRFDDAQKKALLRKSKELNTKFSHGNSSMFL
ncbi:GPALPP motifs-containing protein 1 [Bufo gargarizans]|uniref:GPALPP motifs-containing protein 1 n=1 Tax=Bufo gargarizans TaxID=30331 RepID=UPI001CF129A0|nr:GPALPP motifs-containing protein 1 [Bufo gargarizans]